MPSDPQIIIDAHEDIAWNNAAYGRDFLTGVYHKRRLEAGTPIVQRIGIATTGLPDLLLGRVGIIFGTIYASPQWAKIDQLDTGYETAEQAYRMGQQQVDYYHRLADEHENIILIRTQGDLENVLASWADNVPFEKHKLGIVMLIEGADPIREPQEFEAWYERGVRVVGTAWSETRYSGGTSRGSRGPGPLTKLGHELLEVMESFNAILDLSHMSEESYYEALDSYGGQIIASHSNPRRFRNSDRHLTDDMIRRLAEHNGVMGVVPYNYFLQDGWTSSDHKQKMPLSRVIDVIDHILQVTGSAQYVGIGTDFDGGFGAGEIPAEIDTAADLQKIAPMLKDRGYSSTDISAILSGNFLRILRAALPR